MRLNRKDADIARGWHSNIDVVHTAILEAGGLDWQLLMSAGPFCKGSCKTIQQSRMPR
eukprot:NODE_413_length_1517_cov_14.972071_g305_i0.p9 GENE.NODE_413_length_1517_cov_14.972071_g305_i0~~NODE_413_length_1517_cov_14.972071_g305_i0.p9  ORF type:complete len:58 (+),score=7.15 NODE_413_length_1517_cov_14.972071_g305_i0:687-860(+)